MAEFISLKTACEISKEHKCKARKLGKYKRYAMQKKRKEFDKLMKEITELSNEIWKRFKKMKEENLKFKDYFKLIKQYPDSGYELGDIVSGGSQSYPLSNYPEFWEPVKNKFTRDELIQIMKECDAVYRIKRDSRFQQAYGYIELTPNFLTKLGISEQDFKK